MQLFSAANKTAQEAQKFERHNRSLYPRLKPIFQTYPISPNEIMLRTGVWSGSSFVLTDSKKSEMLSKLILMLNGQHTVDEIINHFTTIDEDEILDAIEALVTGSIVEVVPDLPDGVCAIDNGHKNGNGRVEKEAANGYLPGHIYFSAISRQPTVVTTERLKASTIVLQGCGAIGIRIGLQLAQAGIGRIVCLDDTPLESHDLLTTPYLGAKVSGQTRAQALTEWLSNLSLSDSLVEAKSTGEKSKTNWEEILADCTMAIVAQDALSLAGNQAFNAEALKYKTPWLSVSIDGMEGLVGPLFIPDQTACFTCYELRLESNLINYESYKTSKQLLANLAADYTQPHIGIPGFADVLAGFAAIECVRLIATEYSFTPGKVMRINFQSASVEVNDVLKLPRCPSCGRISNGWPSHQAFHTFEKVIAQLEI